MKKSICQVTAADVGKTQKGYNVYKIFLNKSFWVTKLMPLRERDRKYSKLYQLYMENNKSLDFLINKYICVSFIKNNYGFEFFEISSFDVLRDFKELLEKSNGTSFATDLPIYDFLLSMGRILENDGSIKIKSTYGDMRVLKISDIDVCYSHGSDESYEYLSFKNINDIFIKFYKDVSLPAYSLDGGGESYYTVSMLSGAILRMDNHVRVRDNMSFSRDYDRWEKTVILEIGEKLPEEHVFFLKGLK